MRKIILLSMLSISFAYSQITDENGVSAIGVGNTVLTGKIGVGVSNPAYDLEVNGQSFFKELTVKRDDYTSSPFIARFGESTSAGTYRNFNFLRETNDDLSFAVYSTNYIERFRLTAKNDRTWISLKDQNQNEIFKLSRVDGNGLGSFIQMPFSDSRIVIGSTGGYLPDHKFVVKDGSAMIEGNILTNSNVGIGTDSFIDGSDTYRLSVEGKVRAHEIKVYTTWADFVFNDDYNLPSLSEVENYISLNGHLEGIPSENEVLENGIEIGNMNKLLLQKIEELTLYLIQKDKEIQVLQDAILEIRGKNNKDE